MIKQKIFGVSISVFMWLALLSMIFCGPLLVLLSSAVLLGNWWILLKWQWLLRAGLMFLIGIAPWFWVRWKIRTEKARRRFRVI